MAYSVKDWDYKAAKQKQLVAMVKVNTTEIQAVGIVKENANHYLVFTWNSVDYIFNTQGKGNSENSEGKYELMMAVSETTPSEDSIGETGRAYTRNIDAEGNVTYDELPEGNTYSITVDSINAVDQFAIQALKSMLEKVPDPSVLSNNEMTYYCESAYKWASYMMTESSKARVVIKNGENSSDETVKEEVGYLENNTEKLLNNLVYALEKTDYTEEDPETGKEIHFERAINPKLNELIKNYLSMSDSEEEEFHTFEDLLTLMEGIQEDVDGDKYNRVKLYKWDDMLDILTEMKDDVKEALDAQNQALNNINASIQAFATAMNTRFTALENKVDAVVNRIPDNIATSSDISSAERSIIREIPTDYASYNDLRSAKNEIISAMPTCKYSSPSTESSTEG